ncbi:MAG: AraC family transcriptional regulator ligand-binding domain-containing protein [Umezawaea sp.]
MGDDFAPRLVEFDFPAPSDTGPFGELFRCAVRFAAGVNRLVFAHT